MTMRTIVQRVGTREGRGPKAPKNPPPDREEGGVLESSGRASAWCTAS